MAGSCDALRIPEIQATRQLICTPGALRIGFSGILTRPSRGGLDVRRVGIVASAYALVVSGAGAVHAVGSEAEAVVTVPARTTLSVRLTSRVGSHVSRVDDSVTAVVIAPVRTAGEAVLSTGSSVRGRVTAVEKARAGDGRPTLRLSFLELASGECRVAPVDARVVEVDNARESVDAEGRIVGLRPRRKRPGNVESLLLLAAHAHPIMLATFEAGRLADRRFSEAPIDYGPGIELTLELTAAATVPFAAAAALPLPSVEATELRALVSALPRQAVAAKNGKPSDVTNVLVAGSPQQVSTAFTDAGWTPALSHGMKADAKSLAALANRHGYEPAPVSLLQLEGRRPDLVFEKQANTLAKRHHVRLWVCRQTLGGRPLMLGAATHDVGIRFSREQRTFTHQIDPLIDRERDKIVDDLVFAGRVGEQALVARPDAAGADRNAAGDRFETDGRIAVLVLR
jgi:hypothetical protein